ncbi:MULTISPECIES: SDR family NAD(P)-dependent oxidoreductase [unclassified Mesorhizobium]|uniref:SDR family NAD(P)-dependent oxidoreductase n=1 Tax=unclassified Mesorhizobium TaxID=325217 RepID=UPI001129513F|nr:MULTISPECIES: SDR family NAD(P)-dependent oxidoreductase [unclassified Mesorhizobium]TPI57454.1 SDR family oxidoreductase [Mesorhizobium sp. B3-1-7]TPJ37087.1 SDR family oxidoreductase [Mesorhizobium sp. B2-8-3]
MTFANPSQESSSAPFQVPQLLAGRRAVVTGAARGIGKAIADAFDQAGAAVVRLDINASETVRGCDIADEESVKRILAEIAAEGPIDDIVHAAAIGVVAPLADMQVADFRRVLDVNVIGAFLVAREGSRHLHRGGNLVLIASQYGLKGWPLWGAYCASKAGVLRLADALVGELAPRGIRVNTISPGSVDTEMVAATTANVARQTGSDAATIRASYEAAIPMGRFAQPQEIAYVAVALCSGLCSYVNGSNIVVDGGELSR